MASKALWIAGGVVGAGLLAILLSSRKPSEVDDVQIDPALGKHRGLAPTYGVDQNPTRLPSAQDPQGGAADYLGYNYKATKPSVYAWGEPKKSADSWAHVDIEGSLNEGPAPMRIARPWKDANRFWDSIQNRGGTDVVNQKLHLFHLRPSMPTRGFRSVSGALAPLGGGMSTASRVRIPAIFVPSAVA